MKKKMTIGIRYRVLLVFLAANILVVASMFVATRLSFERGLARYVFDVEKERLGALAAVFEENYATNGNWHFLFGKETSWETLSLSTRPGNPHRRGQGRRSHHNPVWMGPPPIARQGAQSFEKRIALRDSSGKVLFGSVPEGKRMFSLPLEVNGVRIGELGLLPPKYFVDQRVRQFAHGQNRALVFVALGIAVLALLLAFPLTGRFVRRITGLAAATNQLASGNYNIRVPEKSQDELGQLAVDFNRLAETLEKNESMRRQWVADISHELRTPLSVLRGEVEAVQDGVRKMSPELVKRIHAEILHLTRLVNDLYELSLADIGALTYHRKNLDFGGLLSQVLHSYEEKLKDHRLELQYQVPEKPVMLYGDAERLRQLLNNLFQNSLRYTDGGGTIRVQLREEGKKILLSVSDSCPGVPEEALPHLFDRLYRVETSRNRTRGGAGLGLSLCKAVVEAHEGSLEAVPSSLGGLEIRIVLERAG